MAASSPSQRLLRMVAAQSILAGLALGALLITGGGVFLYDVAGLLSASVGVVLTGVAALATGLWAGAEAASDPERPVRGRWYAAASATAVAGAFAVFVTAYPAVRQGPFIQILALLVLVATPVYTVGLLLPSLLAWAERHLERIEADSGDPSPWEPLGQVVVGCLAGLAVGIGFAGLLLVPLLGSGPVLFGAAAAFLIPTLLPEPVAGDVEERVIYEAESALSRIRVVELVYPAQRQPERRLYVNDEEESGEQVRSGTPTLAYIAAAEQWLATTSRRGDSYLFLGGGAQTLPRRVAERDSRARITVVELDPEVTRTAYRFFGVRREHAITTIHGDARAYLDQASASPVDRVYLDVYGGQESLPYSLITTEAFARMAAHLLPGGALTLNVIAVTAGAGSLRFWSLVRTLREIFPAIALFTHLGHDYPERQNVLIAASPDETTRFSGRAGVFEPWPEDAWPPLSAAALFHDLHPELRRDRPAPRESYEQSRGG
jgi:hypothetical protein